MKQIGQSVINNHLFLKKVSKSKSIRKLRRLLRLATNEELFSIVEIAFNILKGHFNLTNKQKQRLIPYANVVRKISRSRSHKGLKKVLQSGEGLSFLPALLAPVIIEAFRAIKNG
jgi:hypothetical protein